MFNENCSVNIFCYLIKSNWIPKHSIFWRDAANGLSLIMPSTKRPVLPHSVNRRDDSLKYVKFWQTHWNSDDRNFLNIQHPERNTCAPWRTENSRSKRCFGFISFDCLHYWLLRERFWIVSEIKNMAISVLRMLDRLCGYDRNWTPVVYVCVFVCVYVCWLVPTCCFGLLCCCYSYWSLLISSKWSWRVLLFDQILLGIIFFNSACTRRSHLPMMCKIHLSKRCFCSI